MYVFSVTYPGGKKVELSRHKRLGPALLKALSMEAHTDLSAFDKTEAAPGAHRFVGTYAGEKFAYEVTKC